MMRRIGTDKFGRFKEGQIMEMNMVEILGYAASIMVAISLTMKDIVKLRILNFIGCALFTAYGLMIDSWPVVLTNGFIACVNVYFLAKMQQEKKSLEPEKAQ
jgi:hypothetical protein